MNTLKNKKIKDGPKDPVDILIYDKGLRITTILPVKELDLLVVVLNSGSIIKSKISCFKLLLNANQEQLNNWKLKNNGTGIRWEEFDEDLSLRGFITNNVMNNVLHRLETSNMEISEII
jgi:hypothetical protein